MEEIVGAEAIQGEILDDARKKAARILEEAEEESARTLAEMEARADTAVAEILKTAESSSMRFRRETMARFPLEVTRMRTTFVDGKLREAVGAYVAALGPERIASLSEAMLAEGAAFLAGKEVELRRRGLSEEAARKASARALPGVASMVQAEDPSLPAPGLVARTLDDRVRLRATMDLVEGRLLDGSRGELAHALCEEALGLGSSEAGAAS
jgi:vacuolar-type H+-ATPase subunit H